MQFDSSIWIIGSDIILQKYYGKLSIIGSIIHIYKYKLNKKNIKLGFGLSYLPCTSMNAIVV